MGKGYAEKNGLKPNPDYDVVVQAIKGLARKERIRSTVLRLPPGYR